VGEGGILHCSDAEPGGAPAVDGRAGRTGLRLGSLGLAWLLGIAVQLQQARLDAAVVYAGCSAAALLGLALAGRAAWRPGRAALALALLSAGGLGFGLTGRTSW